MDEYFKLLGVDENCTEEDAEARYLELKALYGEQRFQEGEAGNAAAKKLTELESARRDHKENVREKHFTSADSAYYTEIENQIKKGDLTEAQRLLDEFNERNAEWHYLQSVVFYKKNWTNESKKQLEIALQMDPDNQKYKNSLDKLNAKINDNASKTFTDYSGNANENRAREYADGERQMGGDGCFDFCCQMAICNILLNCCCNCR